MTPSLGHREEQMPPKNGRKQIMMVSWHCHTSQKKSCIRLRVVKKSGLNIRIAQWSGPTLRSILTRSALEPSPCPSRGPCVACQAGLQGQCTVKNVVYKLECTLCSGSYVGEIKRPVRERIMEHRRAALARNAQNPWGTHFCTQHGNSTSPPINTNSGWRLLPTIRKRSLAKRTHAQKL